MTWQQVDRSVKRTKLSRIAWGLLTIGSVLGSAICLIITILNLAKQAFLHPFSDHSAKFTLAIGGTYLIFALPNILQEVLAFRRKPTADMRLVGHQSLDESENGITQ